MHNANLFLHGAMKKLPRGIPMTGDPTRQTVQEYHPLLHKRFAAVSGCVFTLVAALSLSR